MYWPHAEAVADICFGSGAYQQGHLPAASQGAVARLMFPTTLYVHVESLDDVEKAAFDSNLRLLTGHLQVAAWYWAICCAIENGDRSRIGALWQCALTVTVHLRVAMPLQNQAALSILLSENFKTEVSLATDSFVAFALKALMICKEAAANRMEHLDKLGVRFNGSMVNKSMMTAILIFQDKLSPRAIEALRDIEHKFGKAVITDSYTKIYRMHSGCSMLAETLKADPGILTEYVLENLAWALEYDKVLATNVTKEFLDRPRDGSVGFIPVSMCRREIINLLMDLATSLNELQVGSASASELAQQIEAVLRPHLSYKDYTKYFSPQNNPHASEGEQETAVGDPLEALKAASPNKTAHSIADFAYEVMSMQYDKVIAEELKTKAIKDIKWLDVKGLHQLRELAPDQLPPDCRGSGPGPGGTAGGWQVSPEARV